jgi:hypothetical protein
MRHLFSYSKQKLFKKKQEKKKTIDFSTNMPNITWMSFLAIVQHFMLEDTMQENHLQSEDQALEHMIMEFEKDYRLHRSCSHCQQENEEKQYE